MLGTFPRCKVFSACDIAGPPRSAKSTHLSSTVFRWLGAVGEEQRELFKFSSVLVSLSRGRLSASDDVLTDSVPA